jgi:two-component system chemotaxis response regulator CheY
MKRILVIDDSKTVRFYHRDILLKAGYDVSEAENGMEALEKMTSNSFDLFLVDINMPIMDGYTFVDKLREKDMTTPAIMISTEAEQRDKDMAYKVGATAYFIKPVKPDELDLFVKILTAKLD